MADQQQKQTLTKADRTWFRKVENVLGEDLKALAREGRRAELVNAFWSHGLFLERHPEYLQVPVK